MVLSTTAAGTISQMARGLIQFFDQVGERGGTDRLVLGQILHRFGQLVKDDAPVAVFDQPPNHVGTHPAQAHHAELLL